MTNNTANDNTSANKRIARNSVYMSIRMVIVLFLSLYTTRAVLKLLGVEDYGVYNVVCGFVAMFGFLNTSMSNGIQRFFNYEFGKNGSSGANKVFCTAVIIQFILALIIIILVEGFGTWYLYHKMVIPSDRMHAATWVFHFSIISFVFLILQAPFSAAVMAHERLDFYAIVNVLDAVLKLLIVLAIPYAHSDNLIVYGVALAIVSVLNFVLYYTYCKRHFEEIKFRFLFDKTLFNSMLGFSGWNIFGSFSGVMKEQGINLVMNLFFGPVVNAARGVAGQVNGGLQGFVANLTIPVRPQVIQSYAQGNLKRTLSLTYSISKLSCGFLYLMALPISYEIDYILSIWLGDNIPSHANTFVIIVFFTSFLNNLNAAISGVVHATGRMRKYQLCTSLTAILSVPLAYLVLKVGFAPEWALLMVSFTMIIAQTVALLVLRTLIDFSISEYCRNVIFPLCIIILSTIWIPYIVTILMDEGILRLLVNLIVSSSAVCLAFYFLGLKGNEKEMVKAIIERVIHRIKKG